MITDPFFYLCAIPAVLVFAMAKGGFGGGIAMISVPLMSLAVPPVQAAAILLPLLVVMDGAAIWSFRGQWSRENLIRTLPGAMLGIVAGTFTFHYLSEAAIRLLIGFICVTFCLNYWLRSGLKAKTEASLIAGSFWGAIAGFTSFGIRPPHEYLPVTSTFGQNCTDGHLCPLFCGRKYHQTHPLHLARPV